MTKPIEQMTLRERLDEILQTVQSLSGYSNQGIVEYRMGNFARNRLIEVCSDLPPDDRWIDGPPDVPDRGLSKDVRWLIQGVDKGGGAILTSVVSDFGVRNVLNYGWTILRHQPYSPPGQTPPEPPPCPPVGTPLLLKHKKSGTVCTGKVLEEGLVKALFDGNATDSVWWTGVVDEFEVRPLKWEETE